MPDINVKDLRDLKDLVILKRESPEEYQEFLTGIEEIMLDLIKISKKISEKIE